MGASLIIAKQILNNEPSFTLQKMLACVGASYCAFGYLPRIFLQQKKLETCFLPKNPKCPTKNKNKLNFNQTIRL